MSRGHALLLPLALLTFCTTAVADGSPSTRVPLRDPEDGRFDVSAFLDTACGFVPVVSPITEPAVGYGAVAAAVFIDRRTGPDAAQATRPNIAAVGALGTENGTRGAFGGHLGTWSGGRLRTLAGLASADVNLTYFGLGGDRDFEMPSLELMLFLPLGESLFLGARAAVKDSSTDTPFYLRPYVALRGVEALRYQGEQAWEAEMELRWQWNPRFSAVGFAGAGAARSESGRARRDESVVAGGLGFRYLVARTCGLHMGLEVGFGPDEPVIYVVFGSAWLRP